MSKVGEAEDEGGGMVGKMGSYFTSLRGLFVLTMKRMIFIGRRKHLDPLHWTECAYLQMVFRKHIIEQLRPDHF